MGCRPPRGSQAAKCMAYREARFTATATAGFAAPSASATRTAYDSPSAAYNCSFSAPARGLVYTPGQCWPVEWPALPGYTSSPSRSPSFCARRLEYATNSEFAPRPSANANACLWAPGAVERDPRASSGSWKRASTSTGPSWIWTTADLPTQCTVLFEI